MKTKEEILHECDIQCCKIFHNDLINLLAGWRASFSIHSIIEPELNQLYRIADLIADKIFPHNHEQ